MNLLSWNVRGLGNPRAVAKLRRVLKKFSPSLIFLSETKLRGSMANLLKVRLGFKNGFWVDSEGKGGGLMLLWNENVEVSILSYSQGHIDSMVSSDMVGAGASLVFMAMLAQLKEIIPGNCLGGWDRCVHCRG
ncbi:hypothetical protein ACOSQ2_023390 [Xanthoceras sorbifolium]